MGGFVFSDQYLQVSARIGSPHVYGLGEHLHTEGIKHDMNWRTWPIHAAGKHPTGPVSSITVKLRLKTTHNAQNVVLSHMWS